MRFAVRIVRAFVLMWDDLRDRLWQWEHPDRKYTLRLMPSADPEWLPARWQLFHGDHSVSAGANVIDVTRLARDLGLGPGQAIDIEIPEPRR